jgi:hypothetical protein
MPQGCSESRSRWRRHAGSATLALACLLLSALVCLSRGYAAAPDPVVARHMGAFFAAFVSRELSPEELGEMADEFVRIHATEGKSLPAIHEIARSFDAYTDVVRDRDTPVSLSARRALLAANYFRPAMRGTIELRLLTEPDPVLIADHGSGRLITRMDVAALANLRRFATAEGDPSHEDLAPAEIDRLAEALDRAFGGSSGRLPRFFAEAAAYWAGVRRAWPGLSAEERKLARAYAGKTWRVRMPPAMFAKLLGLDPKAAYSRHADDVGMRLAMITDLTVEAGNLPTMLDSIFPP